LTIAARYQYLRYSLFAGVSQGLLQTQASHIQLGRHLLTTELQGGAKGLFVTVAVGGNDQRHRLR
jgi:hypothetical protein